jgi:hypothetical protein
MRNISDNVVWKTSSPKTYSYTCHSHGRTSNMGNAAVEKCNEVSLEFMEKHKILVYDQASLLRPVPESVEAHHCSNIFYDRKLYGLVA